MQKLSSSSHRNVFEHFPVYAVKVLSVHFEGSFACCCWSIKSEMPVCTIIVCPSILSEVSIITTASPLEINGRILAAAAVSEEGRLQYLTNNNGYKFLNGKEKE